MVVGLEEHVIFRDIWQLDDDEAHQTSLWMARVLTQAAVDESREAQR